MKKKLSQAMLTRLWCAVTVCLLWTQVQAIAPSNKGIGINLAEFAYFSPDFPMINQFKRAGGWYTQCSYPQDSGCTNFGSGQSAWDTLEQSKLNLDENGWIKSLPNANDTGVKYRKVSVLLFQDDSNVHPAGKYVVVYDGKGVIEYSLAGKKVEAESAAGRDVIQVTNSDSSGLLVTIRATDPMNYIRNIRIYPPGGVCSSNKYQFSQTNEDCTRAGLGTLIPFEKLPTSRIIHPSFAADLKGFRTIRFLDWNKTNSSSLKNWADRPKMDDALWTSEFGVPVNAMVSLANEIGADPWINLPMQASDDYAMRFARQVKATLANDLNVIVEYSNEPWNYAFPASHWMKDQAAAKWPDQIKNGVSVYELQPSWYGLRSAQICSIVKKEFGSEAHRVKCVLNGQAAVSWISQQMLNCPYAKANLGGKTCASFVDALAVAPYFGSYIGDLNVRSTISSWYSQPDGGLNKLFEEILGENSSGQKVSAPLYNVHPDSIAEGAVALSKRWMIASFNEANKVGLPLVSYEGGQHLVMAPGDSDQKWLNLIIAANRDPRMGKAYSRTLLDWQSAGGQVYTLFNHVHKPGRYGVWGVKETQLQNNNHKWQSILPYRDTKSCWWENCQRP